jgi:hypothetical protein
MDPLSYTSFYYKVQEAFFQLYCPIIIMIVTVYKIMGIRHGDSGTLVWLKLKVINVSLKVDLGFSHLSMFNMWRVWFDCGSPVWHNLKKIKVNQLESSVDLGFSHLSVFNMRRVWFEEKKHHQTAPRSFLLMTSMSGYETWQSVLTIYTALLKCLEKIIWSIHCLQFYISSLPFFLITSRECIHLHNWSPIRVFSNKILTLLVPNCIAISAHLMKKKQFLLLSIFIPFFILHK